MLTIGEYNSKIRESVSGKEATNVKCDECHSELVFSESKQVRDIRPVSMGEAVECPHCGKKYTMESIAMLEAIEMHGIAREEASRPNA